MTYKIFGKYQGHTEEIDSTDDSSEVNYMIENYQLAFGKGWVIWSKEIKSSKKE